MWTHNTAPAAEAQFRTKSPYTSTRSFSFRCLLRAVVVGAPGGFVFDVFRAEAGLA
jgi:hypothetical protein